MPKFVKELVEQHMLTMPIGLSRLSYLVREQLSMTLWSSSLAPFCLLAFFLAETKSNRTKILTESKT